jgi:hypothetical protein
MRNLDFARVLRLVLIIARSAFVPSFSGIAIPTRLQSALKEAKISYAIFIKTGGVVMMSLKSISNKELICGLKKLVKQEHDRTMGIILRLIELERRRLYLDLGFGSLYDYCTRELKYSESGAMRRICAARAIAKCPPALDCLRDGRVNLSTLSMIWKHITPKLLERICNKSKKETELILSEFDAGIVLKDKIKPVVVDRPIGRRESDEDQSDATQCKEIYRRRGGKLLASVEDSTPRAQQEVERERVTMHEVRCYVDDEVMRQLERCKILLSSKYPQGLDYNRLLRELSAEWLNRHDLSRKAARQNVAKPNAKRAPTGKQSDDCTRHIPENIKRAVYKRDKGRCSFVGSNGKRCNSQHNLEYDHYPVPYARGGPSTVNNLRLICAKHNKHTAIKIYGERAIKKHYIKESCAIYIAGEVAPGAALEVAQGRYLPSRYLIPRLMRRWIRSGYATPAASAAAAKSSSKFKSGFGFGSSRYKRPSSVSRKSMRAYPLSPSALYAFLQ